MLAKAVHLYPPRPATRYRTHPGLESNLLWGSGDNPPQGAILHYHLKARPKGDIALEVRDAAGRLVRTLSSKPKPPPPEDPGSYSPPDDPAKPLPAAPGLHRVVWDLRYEGPKLIPNARADSGDVSDGPLVNPDTYKLRLVVEGKAQEADLTVRLDPRQARGKEDALAGLNERLKFTLRVRDEIGELSGVVAALRSVRKQLQERNALLKEDAAELVKASAALLPGLDRLEEKLHNPKAKVAYDILAQKGGAKLYSQMLWLYVQLQDSDGPVTQGFREVHAEQAGLLARCKEEWRELKASELGRLDALARKLGKPGLVVPG